MDIKESNSSLSVDAEKSFKICITHPAVQIHIFLYLIFMEQDNIAVCVQWKGPGKSKMGEL